MVGPVSDFFRIVGMEKAEIPDTNRITNSSQSSGCVVLRPRRSISMGCRFISRPLRQPSRWRISLEMTKIESGSRRFTAG